MENRTFSIYLLRVTAGILLALTIIWSVSTRNPRAFEELLPSIARDKLALAETSQVSVLILGDSFPATSLDPSAFDSQSLNLAIPGSNPIDILQVLRASLAHSHPKAIVLSLDMEHLMYQPAQNSGGLIFPVLFTQCSSDDLIRQSRYFEDDHIVGPKSPLDIDARLAWFLKEQQISSLSADKLGFALTGSYSQNEGKFLYEKAHQGFLPIEVMVPVDPKLLHQFLNGDAALQLKDFVPNPLLDHYFNDIISLADSEKIPIYYVRGPEPMISDKSIPQNVKDQFKVYLEIYEKKYAYFHVLGELFSVYPDDFFYDGIHLNKKSVGLWSHLVKSEMASYEQDRVQNR